MNKIKLVVLILLYSSNAFAQELISNVILTDQLKERNEVSFLNPVLTWDDFKGIAPKNSEWTAMTYSGIKLRYGYKVWKGEKSVSIMLYPYMDQSKSWYSQAGYNAIPCRMSNFISILQYC